MNISAGRKEAIRKIWGHPAFVSCVALLLLNDWVLKKALHNAFTGKLSDVAGLAVFPAFFCALWPGPKAARWFYLITAIGFTWWKLPLSESTVAFLSHDLRIPVGRVTDPTDLWALLVLPASYRLFILVPKRWNLSRAASILAGGVAFMAFCATSPSKSYLYQRRGETEYQVFKKGFVTKQSPEQILARLRRHGFQVEPDTVTYRAYTGAADAFYVGSYDSFIAGRLRRLEIGKQGSLFFERWRFEHGQQEQLYEQYIHPYRYRIHRLPLKHDTVNSVSFHLEPLGDGTYVRLSEIRSSAYNPRLRQLGRQAKRELRRLQDTLK